jgi:hypothetical protein
LALAVTIREASRVVNLSLHRRLFSIGEWWIILFCGERLLRYRWLAQPQQRGLRWCVALPSKEVMSWLAALPVTDANAESYPEPSPEQQVLIDELPSLAQAVVAHLARLPDVREKLSNNDDLLAQLDDAQAYSHGVTWLREAILRCSGPLVVLHPESGKGLQVSSLKRLRSGIPSPARLSALRNAATQSAKQRSDLDNCPWVLDWPATFRPRDRFSVGLKVFRRIRRINVALDHPAKSATRRADESSCLACAAHYGCPGERQAH